MGFFQGRRARRTILGEQAIGLLDNQGDPLAEGRGKQFMELVGELMLTGRGHHPLGDCRGWDGAIRGLDGETRVIRGAERHSGA